MVLFLVSANSIVLREQLFSFLKPLIPRPFQHPILQYLTASLQNKTLLPYSVLFALWSSAKGIQAVTEGLESAFGSCSTKGYLRKRVHAMLHYGIVLTALLVAIFLIILGNVLLEFLPVRNSRLFMIALKFTPILSITLLFCLLYRSIPDRKPFWRHCLAGAVFASWGWLFLSALFSIYVNHFSTIQNASGLTGLTPLLFLWLKLCLDFLLIGAVLTAELSNGTYHPLQYLKETLFP